jgi:RimJ/RimL family protein N-acetyltransferase
MMRQESPLAPWQEKTPQTSTSLFPSAELAMNTHIDINDTAILQEDLLEKTGEPYALVLLSADNIPQILALQDIAFKDLSAHEQSFLLKKSQNFFEKHFAADNLVLGIVHEGQLIAQSIIVNPTAAHPKTGMVDMPLEVPVSKVSVIQGVIVHPDYRGNHLMTAMVDAWLAVAHLQKRTHVLAEVARDNAFSWSVFLKEGLQIHSIGTDPADNTEVYNIHANVTPLIRKRLKHAFNKNSVRNTVECPQSDVDLQKALLEQGYAGIKFNPANGNISFKPPVKKAAL